jgi:hypothetical protein
VSGARDSIRTGLSESGVEALSKRYVRTDTGGTLVDQRDLIGMAKVGICVVLSR